jgi:lysozyme
MTAPSGILGIDVSSIQSNPNKVDWKKVYNWTSPDGRKIRFAIARAALGTIKDSEYQRNKEGALENGLIFGAYGVLKFNATPEAQADACADAVGELSTRELPIAMDFELEDGKPGGEGEHTAASAYIERLDYRSGRKSYVYTGIGFWQAIGDRSSSPLSNRPLWDAHYTTAIKPLIPRAWHKYAIWQYSGDKGERVDGIRCDVDRNVFAGSEEELLAWIVSSQIGVSHNPPSIIEVQTALREFGYDIGNSGPNKDGVDGLWGKKCLEALLAFQGTFSLKQTGTLDALTLTVLFPAGVETAPGKESIIAPIQASTIKEPK